MKTQRGSHGLNTKLLAGYENRRSKDEMNKIWRGRENKRGEVNICLKYC